MFSSRKRLGIPHVIADPRIQEIIDGRLSNLAVLVPDGGVYDRRARPFEPVHQDTGLQSSELRIIAVPFVSFLLRA